MLGKTHFTAFVAKVAHLIGGSLFYGFSASASSFAFVGLWKLELYAYVNIATYHARYMQQSCKVSPDFVPFKQSLT